MPVDFQTNEEVVRAARRALDQAGWDYLVGGAESETTMRRNRAAFDKWGRVPGPHSWPGRQAPPCGLP